jgi:hypothetical protein
VAGVPVHLAMVLLKPPALAVITRNPKMNAIVALQLSTRTQTLHSLETRLRKSADGQQWKSLYTEPTR